MNNGWTVCGYVESDGYVSSFTAICEDGTVIKNMDGSVYSTSNAVFDDFLEAFKLH